MKNAFKLFGTQSQWLCAIALVAIIDFSMAACGVNPGGDDGDGGSGGGNTEVTLISVTADGSAAQTTTQLTLTFSQAITGLSADDITLSGVTVTKGTLSNSGAAYTLPISGFTAGGTVKVAVSKKGYTISGSSKTVEIYYFVPTPVTLNSVTANGSAAQTTTQLTLTFSQAITGLSASDITLSGVTVTKGTLSNSGAAYTLQISGFFAGGTLSVAVSKTGYTISGSPKTVAIYYYSGPYPDSGTVEQKLTWLSANAVNNTTYTITAAANETFGFKSLCVSEKTNVTNVTILLQGDTAMRTLTLSGAGPLLSVGSGVTLILDNNITLKGNSTNESAVVSVRSGGTLEMHDGSLITGNTATYYHGGGVSVSGTFNMTGGEISGNTCATNRIVTFIDGNPGRFSGGGGVYQSGGTFNMSGGKISNNTASSTANSSYSVSGAFGGGVFVYDGRFNMTGGEISGNIATSVTNSYGGGVYIDARNTGAFSKTGGNISDNNVAKLNNGTVYSNTGKVAYLYASSGSYYRSAAAGPTLNLSSSNTANWTKY